MKDCKCAKCQAEFWCGDANRGLTSASMIMMANCAECGNKRCPKATDHENECTGSNEPGQTGSAY